MLTDGSTDSSVAEKEAFFVMTFDPDPLESKKVKISIFDLVDPVATYAAGISKSIETSFQEYNIEFYQKLVAFRSDGASANSGKNVLKTLLQHQSEWLSFGCCVAHQLELALIP